jgi:hypothetical protein
MIEARLDELSEHPINKSDVYLAHQISGEMRGLRWCLAKFTEPPK